MSNSVNIRKLLINEIALEGLDGITLQTLWIRISEETKTKLPFLESIEVEYWNAVRKIKFFQFFELAQPRGDFVPYNRYAFSSEDRDIEPSFEDPELIPEDIYPHKLIHHADKDIVGSCSTYKTRKDITELVLQCECQEVKEKWGSKLVIVANQEQRNFALTGSYSVTSFELTPMQYCILERVGRTRYRGEITQGPHSLQAVGEDPKSLFYHRKSLLKHQLITKQIYYQKSKAQSWSGTLIHLRRYYIEQKSKYYYLTEQAVEFLKSKPNHRSPYPEMFRHLKINDAAKKLFKTPEFLKFVRSEAVPYRAIYPNSAKSQWKYKNFDKEREIRVLQLIDPNADVASQWYVEEIEEEEEETGYKNYENLCLGYPLLAQAAAVIRDAGEYGLCQTELGNIMGLGRLSARALCRSLMKRDVVTCIMMDVGRQRVTRFVSRRYSDAKITLQYQEERKKLASLISSSPKQQKIKMEVNKDGDDLQENVAPDLDESNSCNNAISQQENDPLAVNTFSKNDSLSIHNDSDAGDLVIDEQIKQPKKKIKLADERKIEEIFLKIKRPVDDSDQTAEPVAKKAKVSEELVITDEIKSRIDKINVKIEVTKADPPAKGNKSISDQLTGMLSEKNQKHISGTVTYRILHRANFIIECVRKYDAITDLTKLLKMIQEHERKEGYMAKIDKKSLMRIIFKLAKDGHIKFMKFTLSTEFRTKEISIICDPSIDENHSLIQSEIDQAKMKSLITVYKPICDVPSNVQSKKSFEPKIKFIIDSRLARVLGFCPKFVRMRLIHEILFYLIREPSQEEPLTTAEEKREWLQMMKVPFDDEIIEEMSPIYYKKELCWKTFVPPLIPHVNWPEGWCFISDILVRLPLEYFVKCCSVTVKIPELENYADHAVRKYFLIRNLPPHIRTGLLYRRKYIFQVHDIVTRLCFIGLLQFGPHKHKEKDQVYIYLNKKSTILNTTPSKPSYHEITPMEYEKHEYTFGNTADVEQFWYDLWSTCMNTRLGGRLCVTGKFVVLEQLYTKQAMIDAMNPVVPEDAPKNDTGVVPGDGRGAAGLDSALFAHLRRNWSWNAHAEVFDSIPKPPMNPQVKKPIASIRVSKLKITRDPSDMLKKLNTAKTLKNTKAEKRRFKIKQKTIVREVKPKTMPKRRKTGYDEIDKIALTKMAKLRTDWSPMEDHILLLCTTASLYMCPNRRRQIIGFTVIRDILHRLVKMSESKTSRACQRRILYIMRNAHTKRSVNMCLEEIKQNENIVKKYKPFADRLLKEHVEEHEVNIVYIHLVSQLTSIFSNLMKPANNGDIPDTMKKFNEMYRVCGTTKKSNSYYKDPKTVQDIQACVIKTIIHSSMCCNRDKVSWAYQLFKVYQQYPEQLLRSVIVKTRQEQLISIKKSYASTNRTNMPLSSSPYKLSIHYHNMLLSKIPFESFHDAFILFTQITELKNKDPTNNTPLEIENPVSGTAIALMELAEKVDLKFKFEIPDDVIVLDQNIVKDKTYERVVERFYNILRDPTRVQKWEEPEVTAESEVEDILPAVSGSTSKETPAPQNEEDSEIDKSTSLGRSVTTRIAFHMMRAEGSEGIDDKSTQHMHDFFVVNGCRVYVDIPALRNDSNQVNIEDITEEYREVKKVIVPKLISKIKQSTIVLDTYASDEELEETLLSYNANTEDLDYATLIINRILKGEVLGATFPELAELISSSYKGNLRLRKILKIMTHLNIVLKTGTEVYRYVHFEHRKPWIIKTYKILRLDREKMGNLALLTDEMKNLKTRKKNNFTFTEVQKSKQLLDLKTQHEIKILISPWIKIDGSVHRRVLDRWMGAVLIAILEKPGINVKFICHKFFLMKPVDLFSIIEYLIRLKCIKQYTTIKSKPTIFSSTPTITTGPVSGLEDPRHIFLEPYSDALTKLTIFIGQKAYSLDFLRAQI